MKYTTPALAGRIPDPSSVRSLSREEQQLGMVLVALPLLLYTFMPRPPVPGVHLLVYPAVASVLAIFVLQFLRRYDGIDRQLAGLFFLLLFADSLSAVSLYVNAPEVRGRALLELLRPLVFIIFVLFSYFVAASYREKAVVRGLVMAAKTILVGQIVVAGSQLFGLPLFDAIYDTEKTSPIWGIVRATGTLTNPNIFGWVVAQAGVITFHCSRRRRYLWVAIAGALILFSGSRSLLLLFPFTVALPGLWRRRATLKRYIGTAVIAVACLAAVLSLVFAVSQYFPYLGELQRLLSSGSMEAIPSLAKRLVRWSRDYDEFTAGGVTSILLGLGSRESLRVVDNDYLYVLFRLGVLGMLAHLMVIAYVWRLLRVREGDVVASIGRQYVVSSLILGVVFETLGGWLFPLIMYFFVGLAVGNRQARRNEKAAADVITGRPPILVQA